MLSGIVWLGARHKLRAAKDGTTATQTTTIHFQTGLSTAGRATIAQPRRRRVVLFPEL